MGFRGRQVVVMAANALRARSPFVRCVNWGTPDIAMSADAGVQRTPGRRGLREIAEQERARFHPGNNRQDFGMGSTHPLMPLVGAGPGRSDKTKSRQNEIKIVRRTTDAVSYQ